MRLVLMHRIAAFASAVCAQPDAGRTHATIAATDAPPERMGRNAEHAQDLAGKVRDARAAVIEGVGHLVHMEASERFDALDFLDIR